MQNIFPSIPAFLLFQLTFTRNKLEIHDEKKFEVWVKDAMKLALNDTTFNPHEKCDKNLADQLMLKYQHFLS